MSGHSKWHSIKHKKAIVDAKRGQMFNKIIREITVAARMGGGDVNANPNLRLIVQKAKSINMPADNIEKAIKRGTGELEGVHYEEVIYEGYGPGGTAILIETLTDNKNRTTAEIRSTLGKNGGNLGENGCVSWNFSHKGLITVKKDVIDEDGLLEIVIDAGAADMSFEEENNLYEIITEPENFEAVKNALDAKKIPVETAEITMLPKNLIQIKKEAKAKQMAKLLMLIEDLDDVKSVYSNADIPAQYFEGL